VRARATVLPLPPQQSGNHAERSPPAKTVRQDLASRPYRSRSHPRLCRRMAMQVATTRSKPSWSKPVSLPHGWQRLAHPEALQRSVRLVRTGIAVGGNRQTWIAIGAAVGHASSHEWSRARKRVGYRRRGRRPEVAGAGSAAENSTEVRTTLKVRERNTLEIGACIVLTSLGVGVQFGRWPEWSALVALGGYVTWVALYAEATVQARRHSIGTKDLVTPTPESTSAGSAPKPGQEHSPA
jgi:hypothetical protein